MTETNKKNRGARLSQKINALANRFFRLILLAVAVVVLVAGYFLVIKDQYGRLRTTQSVDLVNLKKNTDELEQQILSISNYIDQSVIFSADEERLMSLALPEQFDLPSLLIQIDNLAARNGLVVETLSHQEIKEAPRLSSLQPSEVSQRLKKVNVEILANGKSYADFKRFLAAMEKSVMMYDVNVVSFDAANEGATKYEINFITYYYAR